MAEPAAIRILGYNAIIRKGFDGDDLIETLLLSWYGRKAR
jgi:hypothetical protein